MKKNHIQFLEKDSGIDQKFYPMDIYFMTEKWISTPKEKTKSYEFNDKINVSRINYKGSQRMASYSPLSLLIDPEKLLNNE